MAQCKKILEDGKRCSNRTVPGTEYCEQHQRISFRKVSQKPEGPKPPTEKPVQKEQKEGEKPANLATVTAHPSTIGEKPAFPGLLADERNILVAPEGMLWLATQPADETALPLFERLVKLLACLSQETPLYGHVKVFWLTPKNDEVLIHITPSLNTSELSQYYDVVASAAALNGGVFYIGQKQTFIRYRDAGAPRGYDVKDFQTPKGNDYCFVDVEEMSLLSPKKLTEEPLQDLLLRIAPLKIHGASLPETAFVLVAPALYRILARYFREHYLHYQVTRFQIARGDVLVLFEITPCPDAPTGSRVPAFVLSYLHDLPCCTVFTEVENDATHRMLVEWGWRYPCLPRHILGAFQENSLVFCSMDPDFPNICVSPAPTFFDGDELLSIQTPRLKSTGISLSPEPKDLRIELPVRLAPSDGPTLSTAALILDAEETAWLSRLLYRLPGEAFQTYSLCLGRERAILLGEGIPVESLPFGIPMRRVQDTQFFLPLRSRLLPELPWTTLKKVLEIKDDLYTFFTHDFRLDLPRDAFKPLSKVLMSEPGRPRVQVNLQPVPELPKLNWTPPPKPEAPKEPEKIKTQPVTTEIKATPEKTGFFQRMRRKGKPQPEKPKKGTSLPREIHKKPEPVPQEPEQKQEPAQNVEDILRKHAESFCQQGDYLSAAVCFAITGDELKAADCYKEAAQRLQKSK